MVVSLYKYVTQSRTTVWLKLLKTGGTYEQNHQKMAAVDFSAAFVGDSYAAADTGGNKD
jgi:hypothetical protein